MMKFCRKCGENTERHPVSKRCVHCKARLDAAAWERRKAALYADESKREAYRVACRERMRAFAARQQACEDALWDTFESGECSQWVETSPVDEFYRIKGRRATFYKDGTWFDNDGNEHRVELVA